MSKGSGRTFHVMTLGSSTLTGRREISKGSLCDVKLLTDSFEGLFDPMDGSVFAEQLHDFMDAGAEGSSGKGDAEGLRELAHFQTVFFEDRFYHRVNQFF